MSDNEQADWDNLIKSSGFQRLQQWAQKNWTDQIAQLMAGAVNDTNDQIALSKMRQVIAAKKAVDLVMGHPAERLAQLKAEKPQETMSRGGFR